MGVTGKCRGSSSLFTSKQAKATQVWYDKHEVLGPTIMAYTLFCAVVAEDWVLLAASPTLPSQLYVSPPVAVSISFHRHAAELREAGADQACIVSSEAGINLGSQVLSDLGAPDTDISLLRRGIHEALAARTSAALPSATRSSSSASSSASTSSSGAESLQSAVSSEPAAAEVHAHASSSSSSGLNGCASSSSGCSSSSSSNSTGGDEKEKKKKKKQKEPVEMFVLDGRFAYGLLATRAARPTSVEPELPCPECPLVRNGSNGFATPMQGPDSSSSSSLVLPNGSAAVDAPGTDSHSTGAAAAAAAHAAGSAVTTVSADKAAPSSSSSSKL